MDKVTLYAAPGCPATEDRAAAERDLEHAQADHRGHWLRQLALARAARRELEAAPDVDVDELLPLPPEPEPLELMELPHVRVYQVVDDATRETLVVCDTRERALLERDRLRAEVAGDKARPALVHAPDLELNQHGKREAMVMLDPHPTRLNPTYTMLVDGQPVEVGQTLEPAEPPRYDIDSRLVTAEHYLAEYAAAD